jgi:nucleoside 2-deoxyribosyltransferase
VLVRGYERIQHLQKSGKQSSIAFVAMSFHPSRASIYDEAIEPAVRDAGYEPLRSDRFEHVNRIDDEIVGQIKRSRFMIADFSGQRPGVCFEAGLMLGLGRNVIWICEKTERAKVHFDTRQYNFIDYESAADGKVRLFNRILAIENEGPHSSR